MRKVNLSISRLDFIILLLKNEIIKQQKEYINERLGLQWVRERYQVIESSQFIQSSMQISDLDILNELCQVKNLMKIL